MISGERSLGMLVETDESQSSFITLVVRCNVVSFERRANSVARTAIVEDDEDDPLSWQRHHLFCDSLTHRLIGIR